MGGTDVVDDVGALVADVSVVTVDVGGVFVAGGGGADGVPVVRDGAGWTDVEAAGDVVVGVGGDSVELSAVG